MMYPVYVLRKLFIVLEFRRAVRAYAWLSVLLTIITVILVEYLAKASVMQDKVNLQTRQARESSFTRIP
jgi:heme exporter protein D